MHIKSMLGLVSTGEFYKWQKRRADGRFALDFLRKTHVLVVGGGSVGKRYFGNVLGLGIPSSHVSVVEPREDRRVEIAEHFGDVSVFKTEEDAYASGRHTVVIVANPPAFHIESGKRAIAAGAHVLMEKSISHTTGGVKEFLLAADKAGRLVGVCYVYRFFFFFRYIKKLLDQNALGKIFSAQITFSEYLPDWHPWERPSDWYASRKSLGGSELLDENHTVDFSRWFFGEITGVSARIDRISNVTIDSDDFAEFTCFHDSGTVTQIHQDAFGRKPRKDMWIMGEKGTIFWDSYMGGNRVEWFRGDVRTSEIFQGRVSRDDAFFELLCDFLECVASGRQPFVTGWDALKTLEVCAAAEQSSKEGRRMQRTASFS